jgi:hypothetical protein
MGLDAKADVARAHASDVAARLALG